MKSAHQRRIKPTARLYTTTAPTVRKWLRRLLQRGPSDVPGGRSESLRFSKKKTLSTRAWDKLIRCPPQLRGELGALKPQAVKPRP